MTTATDLQPLDARQLVSVYGTVTVRDHFWPAPDGTEKTGITGRITVHTAKDVLGFDVNNRDANWLVEIAGEHSRVVLPGCAVLGFHLHEPDTETDRYLVLD